MVGEGVQLFENSTGYYQRFVYVLDRFKKLMGTDPVASADLSISEDVCQHNMIACASPGWSSKYDIPTDKITSNCIKDNAYVVSQIVQTRPAVIVVVGGSSLEMFAQLFPPYFEDFDYYYEIETEAGDKIKIIKESYQLLNETTQRECWLHIKLGNYVLKSRLVLSPHFSYKSNFDKQVRMSEEAWEAFEQDFNEDAQYLKEMHLVQENT